MSERYALEIGRFGAYFIDMDDEEDLDLDSVKARLNIGEDNRLNCVKLKATLDALWDILRKDPEARKITWNGGTDDEPPKNITNILSATLGNLHREIARLKEES